MKYATKGKASKTFVWIIKSEVDRAAIEAEMLLSVGLVVVAAAITADPATNGGAIVTEGEALTAVVAGVRTGFGAAKVGVAGVRATWAPLRTIKRPPKITNVRKDFIEVLDLVNVKRFISLALQGNSGQRASTMGCCATPLSIDDL